MCHQYEDYDEEEGQLDNQARRERVYGTLRDLQNKLKLRLLSSIRESTSAALSPPSCLYAVMTTLTLLSLACF